MEGHGGPVLLVLRDQDGQVSWARPQPEALGAPNQVPAGPAPGQPQGREGRGDSLSHLYWTLMMTLRPSLL